jgi:EPS-associated MarR family transcriptional regulator
MTPRETAHYRILRLIEEQPEISQRELSRVLGVSLGKAHYLLKALLEKGLVKANNFRRSDNKLAYAYLLTPTGIAAKLELTSTFLRHKEAEYEVVREEIARLRQELCSAIPGKEDEAPGMQDTESRGAIHMRKAG